MAQAAPISIQNLTDEMQQIWLDGEAHVLYAREIRPVPDTIADGFLDQRPKFVREYSGVICDIRRPGEPLVWLANVTGNPFLPKIISRIRVVKGREETFEKVNPLTIPTVFTQKHGRGTRVEGEQHEAKSYHLGFAIISLPPFTRHPFPYSIAEWLVVRDGRQDEGHVGKIVQCRAPQEDGFEPNMTWTLDDMRLYADLVDRGQSIVVSDKALMGIGPADTYETNVDVEKAKVALYRMLFFKLVNEKISLPDRTVFARAKAQRDAYAERDDGAPPLESNIPTQEEPKLMLNLDKADRRLEKKRGPGRPRKE